MVPCKETPTFQPKKWRVRVKPQGSSWERCSWESSVRGQGLLWLDPAPPGLFASLGTSLGGVRERWLTLGFCGCLWSGFSPKGSQPPEECFCVISETAAEDGAPGHRREGPWEKGFLSSADVGCFGCVISENESSVMQCGSLSALAAERPRA